MLVSPDEHVNSVHDLEKLRRSDFINLLGETCARIMEIEGAITVFQHSSPSAPDIRRSSCADHAHVQVAPGTYNLDDDPQLVDALHFESLPDFYNRSAPYDGYIMFIDSVGRVTTVRDIGQPQYLRQRIFEMIGKPDEWDYALFPNEQKMRDTIALFEA